MQEATRNLSHPVYRPDIDGLRAIAVLSVVIYHAFPSLLAGGFTGVDVFFVISGFLISSIIFQSLDEGRFSFREFYARRIKRIFPALLTVLVASYAIGWFVLPAPEFKRLANHIAGGVGFFSNFLLMRESGYFDVASETKPLLHLWSLAVEEQFYIVWPLLAWLAWKARVNRFALTLVIAAISFAVAVWTGHAQAQASTLYYSPQTRFWEILIGAALVALPQGRRLIVRGPAGINRLWSRFPASAWANLRSGLGAVFLAIGVICITRDHLFPGWWALLPTLGTALLISGGANAWINRRVLSSRVLVWIGLISFPLYLWHWPLLSFARIVATDTPAWPVRVALVALAFVLAWLTKALIEHPIRFDKTLRYKTAGLVASMFVVACVAQFTFVKQGLSFRYGKPELDMQRGRLECEERKSASGCSFGNPEAKKLVLVWGDSHAEHLTNALRLTLGDKYRFRSVISGSCFMGEKIFIPKPENPEECMAALARLKALQGEKIYAVIRGQRWHEYGMTNKETIENAIADALTAYGFRPEKMIIVGATPNVDIECAVHNYYARSEASKLPCKAHDSVKEEVKAFSAVTQSMAVPKNVSFFYPYDVLCPNDHCTVIQGSSAFFSDTNHVSTTGAMLLMPHIASLLRDEPEEEQESSEKGL